MSIEPNPAILGLQRAAEDMRGRERYVRLDRNERVTPFSTAEFAAILGSLRAEEFCAYPDPSPLVDTDPAARIQQEPDGVLGSGGVEVPLEDRAAIPRPRRCPLLLGVDSVDRDTEATEAARDAQPRLMEELHDENRR